MKSPVNEPDTESRITGRKKPEMRSIGYIGAATATTEDGVRIARSRGLKTAVTSPTTTGKLKPEPLK